MAGKRDDPYSDVGEVLELSSLIDSLRGIDLEKLASEIAKQGLAQEKALSPQERMIRDLRASRNVGRYLKGKTPRKRLHSETCSGEEGGCRGTCGKRHWKAKLRNRRNYYAEHGRTARKLKTAEMLTTGEGWYEYVTKGWKDRKTPYKLTEEEWLTYVYPTFKDRKVPVIQRYDPTRPISLGNVYVVDSDTRDVLFDGKDYLLRELGYCL